MKATLALALLALLLASGAQAAPIDHRDWDELLHRHARTIRGGQASAVDYAGLAKRAAELGDYLAPLSAVLKPEFDSWKPNEQLAFLINAYNAWTVRLVLHRYPRIDSIKDIGGWLSSPWRKDFIPLLGAVRSLDDIEHGLIRGSPRFHDPRIHFAVNCASIGCPALRAEAYDALRLDAQLEDQTRGFLADRTRNRLEQDTVRVSAIFDWYRKDFEQGWRGARRLAEFLGIYRDLLGLSEADAVRLARGELRIEFLDYDWRLNSASSQ